MSNGWDELQNGWSEIQTSSGSGITNAAGANVVPKSDGTNLVASTITDDATTVTINTLAKTTTTKASLGLGSVASPTVLTAGDTGTGTPRGIMSWQSSTGTDGARLHLRKSRGTFGTPLTVVTGDTLGKLVGSGYDSANFLESASIEVKAAGTIAATRVPTQMIFQTATDATPSVPTTALTLNESQQAVFGVASASTGQIVLANAGSAFLTTLQGGAAAASRTYTWPTNFGAAGTSLTDAAGNGTLSWVSSAFTGALGSNSLTGTGAANRIGTATTADALADTLLATSATTQKGLVVQGKAGQTAVLLDVQASTGVAWFKIGSDGATTVTSAATGTPFTVSDGTNALLQCQPYTTTGLQVRNGISFTNASFIYGAQQIANGNSIVAPVTTLTESAATGFATLTFGASESISANFLCRVKANDATDYQSLTARFNVSSVRKATGNTVTAIGTVDSTLAESAGGSTLTCTFTATEGAGAVTINANAVSSLTQTTLNISFLAETVGAVTVAKL